MSSFRKVKEIKELRGCVLMCTAQTIPQIDLSACNAQAGAEIAEKGHFWMETGQRGNIQRIYPWITNSFYDKSQSSCADLKSL